MIQMAGFPRQSPCQKTSWVPSGDHFAWPDLEQGPPGFPAKPGALFVRLTSSLPSTINVNDVDIVLASRKLFVKCGFEGDFGPVGRPVCAVHVQSGWRDLSQSGTVSIHDVYGGEATGMTPYTKAATECDPVAVRREVRLEVKSARRSSGYAPHVPTITGIHYVDCLDTRRTLFIEHDRRARGRLLWCDILARMPGELYNIASIGLHPQ